MSPSDRPILAALALVAGAGLCACTGATAQQTSSGLPETSLAELEPPPPEEPEPTPEQVAITPPDEAAQTLVQLNIDPTVSERCGPIELPAPMFRFDSADPTPEAARNIRQLGECLVEGPLQGAEVVLIGHADPWGDGDYNRRLAERRARTVASLLRSEGVAGERIAVESRGERAATAQPDHWPIERRVDIAVKL